MLALTWIGTTCCENLFRASRYLNSRVRHHHFRIPTHISCRLCMPLNTAAAVLLLTVAHIPNVSDGTLPYRGRSCKPKLLLPTHLHVIIRPTEQNRRNKCILVYRTTLKDLKQNQSSLSALRLLTIPAAAATAVALSYAPFSIPKRRTRCF